MSYDYANLSLWKGISMKPAIHAHKSLKIDMSDSYKCGVDEVAGLKRAMGEAMLPVLKHLNALESWSGDGWFKFSEAEYKSRDGFRANSSNCGGVLIESVIPKCGEYDFDFLEFGEYSEREPGQSDEDYDSQRDSEECDGHLDAALRIWFKFEGFSDEGKMQFYVNASGGNGDAPYFRTQHLTDFFEASFECKTLAELKRKAAPVMRKLIKELGGK
jgi:hypothetical protein